MANNIMTNLQADWECGEWVDGYFDKFDPEEFVLAAKNASIDSLEFWAKDHFGNVYYPSKISHQHRVLNGRDIFGEMCEACLKHDVIPRAAVMLLLESHFVYAHPEAIAKDQSGRECWARMMGMEMRDPAYVCVNNTAYREYVKEVIREVMERYPIRGFLLDMIIWPGQMGACYCDKCQQRFFDLTGSHIPITPSWDPIWKKFLECRYSWLEEFGWELQNLIHEINPEVDTKFNAHGYPLMAGSEYGHRPVQHTRYTDVVIIETYPSWGSILPSFNTRFALTSAPDKGPPEAFFSSTSGKSYTVRPGPQMEWDMYTVFANGGYIESLCHMYSTGETFYPVFDRLGPILKDVKENQELFEKGEFIKETALYYSPTTNDWYRKEFLGGGAEPERDSVGTGASAPFGSHREAYDRNHALSIQGAYQALMESQINADVLHEENITIEQMKQYPVLILPNVAILSEREQEMVRKYVSEGGNLVATADTSRYDVMGVEQNDFGLSDLFGTHCKGKSSTTFNFFRIPKDEWQESGIDPRHYIPVTGKALIVEGGKLTGELYDSFMDLAPERGATVHSTESPTNLIGSSIVTNTYGKGAVIYIPFDLTFTYGGMDSQQEQRLLLKAMVESLLGKRKIDVVAPTNVEVVKKQSQSGKELLVHLIGFNAGKHQTPTNFSRAEPIMYEPPMYRAKITVQQPIKEIKTLRASTNAKMDGNAVSLVIESVHEAVRIFV